MSGLAPTHPIIFMWVFGACAVMMNTCRCSSLVPRLPSRTRNNNVVTFDPANFRLCVRSKVTQLL